MRALSASSPRRPRRRSALARLRWLAWGIGVPLLLGASLFGAARLARTPFGSALASRGEARFLEASAGLGFSVANIEVAGRQTTRPSEILDALRARSGTPIFAVDLAQARRRLEALPWVRSALIERRLPDTIFVRLVERQPLALWQHGGKIELIDRDAEVIPVSRLDRFAGLPMVVGEGAARHALALVAMLASDKALAARVGAAVWIGGRRWNLRIDNRIDVLLPEKDPAAAWAELARLEAKDAILQRDVESVDMRLPDRLVLKVTNPPKPPGDKKNDKKSDKTSGRKSDKKKVANRT